MRRSKENIIPGYSRETVNCNFFLTGLKRRGKHGIGNFSDSGSRVSRKIYVNVDSPNQGFPYLTLFPYYNTLYHIKRELHETPRPFIAHLALCFLCSVLIKIFLVKAEILNIESALVFCRSMLTVEHAY